jgi:hypothetical protein
LVDDDSDDEVREMANVEKSMLWSSPLHFASAQLLCRTKMNRVQQQKRLKRWISCCMPHAFSYPLARSMLTPPPPPPCPMYSVGTHWHSMCDSPSPDLNALFSLTGHCDKGVGSCAR